MTADDLRTRAREAAETRFPGSFTSYSHTYSRDGFIKGALWHATQQPTREQIRDELAHWPIGHGYESASVSIDDAGDMADAVLALLNGGQS